MKIICISDTHTRHDSLSIPECDVLIFAGDSCSSGELHEATKFVKWLANYKNNFKKVILIAGNHDWCFQKSKSIVLEELAKYLEDKFVYLEDEEYVFDGIKFYGTPWQPTFFNWAFNLPRGERLKMRWDNIPEDTNVLITHGPPHGIADKVDNIHVGCIDLLHKVENMQQLFLHVFGHIHSQNGHYISECIPNVNFCNASICDEAYNPTNFAYEINIQNVGTHHFVTCKSISIQDMQK
jgi:Icc-related predicted phosphoesterase